MSSRLRHVIRAYTFVCVNPREIILYANGSKSFTVPNVGSNKQQNCFIVAPQNTIIVPIDFPNAIQPVSSDLANMFISTYLEILNTINIGNVKV